MRIEQFRSRHRVLVRAAAALALLQTVGCTCGQRIFPQRLFPDEASTREHFESNHQLFTEMAQHWLAGGHQGFFCYFGDDDYRWDSTFIRKKGSGYTVDNQVDPALSVDTLDEAAAAAGVDPDEFGKWIRWSREAKVYSITSWPWGDPASAKRVDILLWGSETNGYGLRYVPPENKELSAELFEMIRDRSFSLDTGTMSHIEGPWFYFEGLR